jgi:hypothetical protein
MPSALRENLHGFGFDQDRLWVLRATDGVSYAITEYNDELTGYDPRLGIMFPEIFYYGGNAYYITGRWCAERGWTAEPTEDRI